MRESKAVPMDWVVNLDVDADAELHRIARAVLAARPRDARPVHRAVAGGIDLLLSRRVPLAGSIAGDHEGPVRVSVQLPSGPRRALRLLAAAVPSRWRWRSEGEDLVGRAPREDRDVPCELIVEGRLVSWHVAFDPELPEVSFDDVEAPMRGLRRGEVHLRDVDEHTAEVHWLLGFDDGSAAAAAEPRVEELLGAIAGRHEAAGLGYDGRWSRDGNRAIGRYRAHTTDGWAPTVARLVEARS